MKNENIAWAKAAVLICTKCGKSISGAPKDLAEELKMEMKTEMKNLGLAKDIRVMTSSCLDICEDGYQAVAFLPRDGHKAIVKVFDPLKEKEALKREILALKG